MRCEEYLCQCIQLVDSNGLRLLPKRCVVVDDRKRGVP
jgi:hypothetical protein